MATRPIATKIQPPACGTRPGTPEWSRHLDDLRQLAAKSEHLYPLGLELSCLILAHKGFEWTKKEKDHVQSND
jgi:hypothetical protein